MTLEEFLADPDWATVFGTQDKYEETRYEMIPPGTEGDPKIKQTDILEILYEHSEDGDYGEWNGSMIGRLADGRFVVASGWCDTSGWG